MKNLNFKNYKLVKTDTKLELINTSDPKQKPLFIDFLHGKSAYRRHHGGGRGQLLVKAIKIKNNPKPFIFDATAGLGQDAFVLASLGCRVLMCERSPILFNLLQDALNRLKQVEPNIDLHLIKKDSKDYLLKLNSKDHPDVIYIDTMFPHRKKSALVKKEMRILRELVGEDIDAEELFSIALKHARYKVVVKRPRVAPVITSLKPTFIMNGESSRFDIYFV